MSDGPDEDSSGRRRGQRKSKRARVNSTVAIAQRIPSRVVGGSDIAEKLAGCEGDEIVVPNPLYDIERARVDIHYAANQLLELHELHDRMPDDHLDKERVDTAADELDAMHDYL